MLNNEKLIFVDIRPDHYQLVLVFMTHIKLSVAYKCTIKIKTRFITIWMWYA